MIISIACPLPSSVSSQFVIIIIISMRRLNTCTSMWLLLYRCEPVYPWHAAPLQVCVPVRVCGEPGGGEGPRRRWRVRNDHGALNMDGCLRRGWAERLVSWTGRKLTQLPPDTAYDDSATAAPPPPPPLRRRRRRDDGSQEWYRRKTV